jgi:NAD(P)-dependent dehydrogenase (short-subunit alcohol dehydrogenase family)
MAPVTTPFGFKTTAAEIAAGINLTGHTVIVTGGGSGIGIETARVLASTGADVTLAVRRPEAVQAIAEDIRRSTGNEAVSARMLDLADLESVRAFASAWDTPLSILVNNAGIMALPELERSDRGYEMQFATNFLGHFALTTALYPALVAARGARVVSLASSANMLGPVIWDDPHFRFIGYTPFLAYAQSKTACILLAIEAHRRWASDQIFVNACNPGAIETNLQRHTGGLKTPPERRKTVEQGAANSILLALSPHIEGVGGRYFDDCNEAPVVDARPKDFGPGVAPYAIDGVNGERLWEMALKMIAADPQHPAGR